VRRAGVEIGDDGDGQAVKRLRPALERYVDPPQLQARRLDQRPGGCAGG
jgi:hypothetical protein